jgi:DNA-binding LacI/PurR family transcriptional regulator
MSAKPSSLPPGRKKSNGLLLSDQLAESLLGDIRAGRIRIGQLMTPERDLACDHKVGRVTVRTALKKLACQGFLECVPRVGYRVVRSEPLAARTRPVGLIRSDVSASRAPSKTVGVLERMLGEAGRALIVGSSMRTADGENACMRRFKAAGMAGLIVTPAIWGKRSLELERWIRSGMPTVLEGHPGLWLLPDALAGQCDQFDLDNHEAIREAMACLHGLGHVRFAYATAGPRKASERVAAFEAFVSDHASSGVTGRVLTDLEDAREGGHEACRLLLGRSKRNRPTAVVCSGSDTIALGVIDGARSAGLRCPKDISVVSFGDNRVVDDSAGLSKLTTLEYREEEGSRKILGLLLDRMAGRRRSPRHIRMKVDFVRRGSCAKAPGR